MRVRPPRLKLMRDDFIASGQVIVLVNLRKFTKKLVYGKFAQICANLPVVHITGVKRAKDHVNTGSAEVSPDWVGNSSNIVLTTMF
jgi:hypothetical protein